MSTKRKQYNAQFRFELAVEAAKGLQTTNQVVRVYGRGNAYSGHAHPVPH